MSDGISLQAAFLADYASPSNGLLQVVNGGINTLWRSDFPSPLKIFVAGFIRVSTEHDGSPVQASFVVRSTENEDVYAQIEPTIHFPALPAGERVSAMAPLVVDLSDVMMSRTGLFAIVVTVGDEVRELDFQIVSALAPNVMTVKTPLNAPPVS